ncbi:hypothetical protein GHT06_001878 [Daphnia sinensis]|uniref:Uncharacterized protein n=1 Tax=Daphnia sinensis TaxID=1820382 RepID=A0AAD5PLB9_9CRUS|nr:hypothetical protein GHT06_001878 [Daphnia sinensis]
MFGAKIVNQLMNGADKALTKFAIDDIQKNTPRDTQSPENLNIELLNKFFSTYAEPADPTKGKVYVPWIAREYGAGRIRRLEDLGARIAPALEKFERFKRKKDFPQEAKDLMRLTAENLETIMANYEPEEEIDQRGQAQQVYMDETVRVIVPLDVQASCFYGQGTRWCTASTSSSNYYDHYARQGKLYILLPKQPQHDGEKYQLHFASGQFMDESDHPVDVSYIIGVRFPRLLPFFKEHDPEVAKMLEFANESDVAKIMSRLSDIISEAVWDELNDWEGSDDSWDDYRAEQAREKGYVDENDEVDWDQVYEDPELNDYTEYNYEAEKYSKTADKIGKMNLRQILDSDGYENWKSGHDDRAATLDDIPDIIAAELEDHEINGPAEFVNIAVIVTLDKETGEYSVRSDFDRWRQHCEYKRKGRRR